jgi:type IV secretion system protein TrbL
MTRPTTPSAQRTPHGLHGPDGRRPRRAAGALVALALALALPLALATPAALRAQTAPDGLLDTLVRSYQDLSASWLDRIQPLAQRTFALLATLELAVSGLLWAIGRDSPDAAAAGLLRKMIVLSFLFSLLTLFPLWIPSITSGFDAAGQTVSATAAVNPSQILDLGATIASRMALAMGSLGILVNPVGTLLGTLACALVVLAFAFIAAQVVLTLVETYLVLTGGALFLGFAGFRLTAPLAEGYLAYAFEVGIRIYLLYLLLGVGTGLAQQWAVLDYTGGTPTAIGLVPSIATELQVMGGALIFCLLVWSVPRTFSARLVRGLNFHLAAGLR